MGKAGEIGEAGEMGGVVDIVINITYNQL